MIKQCFKNPSKYFKDCQDARDLAYKRIEPLLGDAAVRPKPCTKVVVDDKHEVGHTGQGREATAVRIAAVEAACVASGWQLAGFARDG